MRFRLGLGLDPKAKFKHGALGAACFLLSTFDDRRAGELVVKLDNFGFARMARRPVRASSSEGAFRFRFRVWP